MKSMIGIRRYGKSVLIFVCYAIVSYAGNCRKSSRQIRDKRHKYSFVNMITVADILYHSGGR